MKEHSKKRSRTAKLLGGAIVGSVLSIGVVADSASAWTRINTTSTTVEGGSTGTPGVARMMSSGIRW